MPDSGAGFGGFIPVPQLARAWGPPPFAAAIRRAPGDFVVVEELGFEPDGDGPHFWLEVRKIACTTPFAARVLAARFSVPVRDVGFAGLKDRHAVTTQWFSLPARAGVEEPVPGPVHDGVCIVRAARGRKKIRRGAHAGNRFRITLREVEGDAERFAARVERVRGGGVPNYFGATRFGLDGGNVRAAAALLTERRPAPDRFRRGLYYSTARALLFNRVLHARVASARWNAYICGDAILIDGRRRPLAAGAPPREGGSAAEWVAGFRAHPTGPLWGRGEPRTAGEALAVERAALAECGGWRVGLEAAGLEADRRALRVRVGDLGWEEGASGEVVVRFRLIRGAYATAVLRELVRERGPPPDFGGSATVRRVERSVGAS